MLSICIIVAVSIVAYRSFAAGGTVATASEFSGSTPVKRVAYASVGENILYEDEIILAGLGRREIDEWIEDELLAQLALEMELENSLLIALVQNRAEQLYLRDAMLGYVYATVVFPDSEDIFEYMKTDSLLFLVERHYYRILLADSSMADSIHARLTWGDSFRLTAERISIGQKAGIGGDLGYMTGGELVLAGFPEEIGYLDGLSDVYTSSGGANIFKTSDERVIEDTLRAIFALAPLIYQERLEAARDSLLDYALDKFPVYLDSTMVLEDST